MLVALAFCFALNPSAPIGAEGLQWTCRESVYELAQEDGVVYARTSGGIVAVHNGYVDVVQSMPEVENVAKPNIKGDGAFISAATPFGEGLAISSWGGKNIQLLAGTNMTPLFPRPPANGEYSLLDVQGKMFAGTDKGLFVREESDWRRIDLGGELPFPRVHGIVSLGEKFVIGGPDGAAFGKPGNWNVFSKSAVRQIAKCGSEAWVLYGSGAIDVIDKRGKARFDILHGVAKRPWASAILPIQGGVLIGGSGGWLQKGRQLAETYPIELSNQVVTAIARQGKLVFVGTQGKGLAIVRGNSISFVNPSLGLQDTWVTGIAVNGKHVLVATATAGLFEIRNGRAFAIDCPSPRIRGLLVWNRRLAIGSLNGAWVKSGESWRKLPGGERETTCLSVVGGKLWICTPAGIAITR